MVFAEACKIASQNHKHYERNKPKMEIKKFIKKLEGMIEFFDYEYGIYLDDLPMKERERYIAQLKYKSFQEDFTKIINQFKKEYNIK